MDPLQQVLYSGNDVFVPGLKRQKAPLRVRLSLGHLLRDSPTDLDDEDIPLVLEQSLIHA